MLQKELNIDEDDTLIPGGRYHNMKGSHAVPGEAGGPHVPQAPRAAAPVLDFDVRPMMDTIRERDVLITTVPVLRPRDPAARAAAIDPVKSIKMTMYRSANHFAGGERAL